MLLITLLALAAPAPAGKTMAMDDWHQANIVSVGSASAGTPATYLVIQAGDLDGDGIPDDAYLKLACADGKLTQAWYKVRGPRDAASGMASGKRQHGSVTFVKEWGAATPQLSAMKPTYDVKMQKSARLSASGDWAPISLANIDGLCAAASDAAKTVTKTSSNIQNN